MPRRKAYRIEEQLGWDELPAELTPEQLAEAGAAAEPKPRGSPQPVAAPCAGGDRAGETPFNSRAVRRHACRRGRPRMPTPTCTGRSSPTTATVVGNCASPRSAPANTTRTTSCSTSARCRSRCSRASRSASCRPASTRSGKPHSRAPVLGRQPAQRRAAGLQQHLADHQARARGPPGPAGARRGQQLHVRPEGRRQGAGDRPLRRQLPDAEPSAQPHRDDLHRHRQRADARDDRMAPAPAQAAASSRAAS